MCLKKFHTMPFKLYYEIMVGLTTQCRNNNQKVYVCMYVFIYLFIVSVYLFVVLFILPYLVIQNVSIH